MLRKTLLTLSASVLFGAAVAAPNAAGPTPPPPTWLLQPVHIQAIRHQAFWCVMVMETD
jgi:hypothetical protein